MLCMAETLHHEYLSLVSKQDVRGQLRNEAACAAQRQLWKYYRIPVITV